MLCCAQSFQSCLTLCDPMDHGLSGFSVHSPGKNTGVGGHFLLQYILESNTISHAFCKSKKAVYQYIIILGNFENAQEHNNNKMKLYKILDPRQDLCQSFECKTLFLCGPMNIGFIKFKLFCSSLFKKTLASNL